MAISAQTFPGVYPKVIDDSFFTPATSRFHAGLIGVAEKGPFNTPTAVRSLKEYRRIFGKSIENRYMASAAAILSDLSDGTVVVRVGRQYESVAVNDASGSVGTYQIFTPRAALFKAGDYVRITQPGKKSTVNARIDSVPMTNDRLVLVSATAEAQSLQDGYAGASIDTCPISGAANEAEAFLQAYAYDATLTLAGDVVGDKNAFEFTVNGDQTLLTAGDLIKIEQTGRATTREVRIKEVKAKIGGLATIKLDTSNNTEVGYQALPLQDSYTAGRISKVTISGSVPVTTLALPLLAASAGTWANSDGVKTGLIVLVSPGSKADTKRILVYEDSGLVESIDNLSTDAASADYYVTRIQGKSQYITIPPNYTVATHPANTVNPWNKTLATPLNIAAFDKGWNGLEPAIEDFVGTINPADDSQTGLKSFIDENLTIDVLCAPDVPALFFDNDVAVAQELARVARNIFAVGLIDVPKGLNAREATDWHNGAGLYSYRGKLDTYSLACCWNWITVTDVFTGELKAVPPSTGVLRCLASTFDKYKPWFAAAGENRGVIPEATAVEFPKVAPETRAAMYGEGNGVNPILLLRGRIMNFGERTLQRTESKLTALHSVILTNHIVRGMSEIGRRFVFDPNDQTLLAQMRLAFQSFMDGVQNERGVEEYALILDESNNNATTRNNREVIVDLSYIPVDAVERIFINATVRESGAQLNAVN
jgi:hypothetical protein